MIFTRDVYAQPQVVLTIQSPNEKDFAALTGGKLSGLLKENAVLVEKDMEGQMKAPGQRFHLVTTVSFGDGSRRQVDMQGCRGEREEEKDLVFVFVTAVNEELRVYEKDHITGFPGMRQFLADSETMVREGGHPEKYALLFFDIVHFKFFNVTYGIPDGGSFSSSDRELSERGLSRAFHFPL